MLYVFLYISELLVSVLIIFRVYKSVGRYSPQFKANGDRDRGSVYRGFVEEPYHRLLLCSLYIELFHASISIYTESTSSSLW